MPLRVDALRAELGAADTNTRLARLLISWDLLPLSWDAIWDDLEVIWDAICFTLVLHAPDTAASP